MPDTGTFDLQIHGENLPGSTLGPPTEVRVGIQVGETVEQEVPADADSARFIARLQIKGSGKDGRPSFSGPYVFGPSGGKFLYLSWIRHRDGTWERIGRSKLRLDGLGWDRVRRALNTGQHVELVVILTNPNGKPALVTVDEEQMTWGP